MRLRLFMLMLSLWLVGSDASLVTLAQPPDPPPSPLGVVDGYWRPQAAAQLNLGWERITFDWARIQPNGPGDLMTDHIRDEWLRDARQQNRQVVGLLTNTPPWASESGLPSAVPVGLYAPHNNPENLWAVFLRQLIPVYAEQGVHHWVIWHTPDIRPGDESLLPVRFDGAVEDYYRLVKIAYQTIKDIDPQATILLGGLAWWPDVAAERELYLDRLLAIIGNDPTAADNNAYFDGVALTLLLTGGPPGDPLLTSDAAGDIPARVQTILAENGLDDKTIWLTELGASPTADPALSAPYPDLPLQTTISLQQQADFVVHGTLLALAAGAERVAVYKLFDSNFKPGQTLPFGLLRADNSPRPAYDAYQFISQLVTPGATITAGRSQNGRLVVIERAGDTPRTVYAMWSTGEQAVNFWIEADFDDEVLLYNSLGEPLPSPRVGVGIDEATVHVVETTAAQPDPDGVVRVSGSPYILILPGAPRAVWAAIGSDAVRLR